MKGTDEFGEYHYCKECERDFEESQLIDGEYCADCEAEVRRVAHCEDMEARRYNESGYF